MASIAPFHIELDNQIYLLANKKRLGKLMQPYRVLQKGLHLLFYCRCYVSVFTHRIMSIASYGHTAFVTNCGYNPQSARALPAFAAMRLL